MINSKIKKIIRQFGKTPVDKNWLKLSQKQMVNFIELNPVRKTAPVRQTMAEGFLYKLILKPMPIAIITLIVSLAAGSGIVTAAQTSLPTDALYPVKIAAEKFQEAMTFNGAEKINLSVKLADKRLDEVKQLQKQKNVPAAVIEKTLIKYEKHLTDAQSQFAVANSDGSASKVISSAIKYENSLEKQGEKLASLTDEIPAESKPSLIKAQKSIITNSNQALEDIKIKIQGIEAGRVKAGTSVASDTSKVLSSTTIGKVSEYMPNIYEKTKNLIKTAENKLAEIRKKIDAFSAQNDNKCGLEEKQTYMEKLEADYKKMQSDFAEARKLFDQKNYLVALSRTNVLMASAIDTDNLVGQQRSRCGDNQILKPIFKPFIKPAEGDDQIKPIDKPFAKPTNGGNQIIKPSICSIPKCSEGEEAHLTTLFDSNKCPIYRCPK